MRLSKKDYGKKLDMHRQHHHLLSLACNVKSTCRIRGGSGREEQPPSKRPLPTLAAVERQKSVAAAGS